MDKNMKALVLEEYGKFVYKDAPVPEIGDGDVLVRVMACSVCGSDVHGMDGSTGRRIPPLIMGHEAAGTVEKIGKDVRKINVGDRVTFDSTVFCGECRYCKAGAINLCDNRLVIGVSCGEYKMDGAFAEYVAVPARVIFKLPDNVSFQQAAMIEPLAVAYHATSLIGAPGKAQGNTCNAPDKAGAAPCVAGAEPSAPGVAPCIAGAATCVAPGSALVVGCGTIGLLIAQMLRVKGYSPIFMSDVAEEKLGLASSLGFENLINSKKEPLSETVKSLTGGHGAALSFDAVGVEASVWDSITSLAKGGECVLVGNITPGVPIPLQQVVTKQLTLYGSCASSGEYPQCLELIAEGKVNIEKLISKTVPLSEGNEWIQKLYRREPGLYKIVLIP